MCVSRMTGTPWHPERIGRKEGDTRRHKIKGRPYTGSIMLIVE